MSCDNPPRPHFADTDELLDYADIARALRLRGKDGSWSADAARMFIARHPELKAKAIYIAPRQPRWRVSDLYAWLASSTTAM